MTLPLVLASLLLIAVAVQGDWSFELSSNPIQCGATVLNISGGVSPLSFIFLGFPPADCPDAVPSNWTVTGGRASILVFQLPENTTQTSIAPYALEPPFAAGQRMVVVGSDATGYGTGGTTAIYTIGDNNKTDCLWNLPPNNTVLAYFQQYPTNVSQCDTLSVQWSSSLPGSITVDTVVPGGTSYRTMTNQTLNSGFGTLSWDIDVSAGSEVAFVLGDYGNLNNIGNPVVLSQLMNVGPGTSNCSASIPQSVSPVPFSTATGLTSATGMSISSDSSNNAGAIAGGVIGGVSGVLLIITIALFVMRMHNRRKRMAAQQQFALKIWRHSGPDRSAQAGKRYTDLPEEPEQSMPVQSMPVRGEAS